MKVGSAQRFRAASLVGGLLSSTILASVAIAQDSAEPIAEGPAIGKSEETVVVTATRRATTVQDVPFSINAISGKTLEDRQTRDMNDLVRMQPGIVFSNGLRQQSFISIRGGLNPSTQPGVDQAVAVYVDDVPVIGGSELRMDFFDLDHVEVLRGPQGTLFGRNVTGGLISMHTRDPSFETGYSVSGTYGSFNERRLRGTVTGALTDTLAARLTLSYGAYDGFQKNINTGETVGDLDESITARAKLLYKPSELFSLLIGADYFHEEGDAQTFQFFSPRTPACPTGCQPGSNTALPNPYGANPPFVSFDPDVNVSDPDFLGTGTSDVWSLLARMEADIGGGTLTSISAYRNVRVGDVYADKLGTPVGGQILLGLPGAHFGETMLETNEQFSQEIRFASNAEASFRWLAGVLLLNQRRDQRNFTDLVVLKPDPRTDTRATLWSYGLFGEVSYDFTESVTLTAGGRYTWENRDVFFSGPAFLITGPQSPSLSDGSWEKFTPKVTLTYRPNDDLLFYATASNGFKSGGFDGGLSRIPDPSSPLGFSLPAYEPENVWNYEVGAKTAFFDQMVTFNIALFRQKYEDLQRSTFSFDCFCFSVGNIDAWIEGFETEFTVRPTDWLTIGGTWSHYRSETDIGSELAPKNSANLYARADWSTDFGEFFVGGDITFRSAFASPLVVVEPTYFDEIPRAIDGLVNMQVGFRSVDGRFDVTLWSKNLTDVRFGGAALDVSTNYDAIQLANVRWNAPRSVGLTVTYHH